MWLRWALIRVAPAIVHTHTCCRRSTSRQLSQCALDNSRNPSSFGWIVFGKDVTDNADALLEGAYVSLTIQTVHQWREFHNNLNGTPKF